MAGVIGVGAVASLLVACNTAPTKPVAGAQAPTAADLYVVDCLLPGQIRQLGATSYMTPRRPVLTTAADCRIRGGEYVSYDRANYKTALQVWLATAELGDAEAQTNVGEIFERGLGGEPNYAAAIIWYQKAAEQGNARAQFNLGTLYEQGLGVPKDKMTALNWYRKAWGLPQDNLIYQSAADSAQKDLRAQLQKTVDDKTSQISLLNNQIKNLQATSKKASEDAKKQAELAQLRTWVNGLDNERVLAKNEINKLAEVREPQINKDAVIAPANSASELKKGNLQFGKYYALIIANQQYDHIESLKTPHADAKRAKKILEEKYGFQVTMVLDGNNSTVMRAINDMDAKLEDGDNLLIFYAGHGSRVQAGGIETGYWLPSNATPPPDDTFWVSNEFVNRHLARLKAKRVLVVADSCYAGLLSTEPGYLFMGDKQKFSEDYIRYKLPKKSRLLLSSGGDLPVLDNAGEGHSVFARAFLDALDSAKGVISGPELFLKIKDQVSEKAKSINFVQLPEFKAIKGTGHEVGDFFFVSK
ncbi:MAG: peptidase C14 [Gammaproteobacteria bacterium]|nr:MAG: peptidase C14 [Gammaproteobacteria bacterium]